MTKKNIGHNRFSKWTLSQSVKSHQISFWHFNDCLTGRASETCCQTGSCGLCRDLLSGLVLDPEIKKGFHNNLLFCQLWQKWIILKHLEIDLSFCSFWLFWMFLCLKIHSAVSLVLMALSELFLTVSGRCLCYRMIRLTTSAGHSQVRMRPGSRSWRTLSQLPPRPWWASMEMRTVPQLWACFTTTTRYKKKINTNNDKINLRFTFQKLKVWLALNAKNFK